MARRSEGLSERHKKILSFLMQFSENNGYSPSIREIGDSIKVKSTSLVDYYLKSARGNEIHLPRGACFTLDSGA